MQEAKFVTRVEVQQEPDVNMMTNPNAEFDLTNATGVSLDLFRDASHPENATHNTAFELVYDGTQNAWLEIGGGLGGIRLGMQPNTQYTVRGTAHIESVLPGSALANRGRRIVVVTATSGGGYVETPSDPFPNTVGVHDVSLTFTTPSNLTEAAIRFYHGHTGGSVYWFNLRLTPGTDATPFDGSSYEGPYFTDAEFGWDERPGRSSSWRVERSENYPLHDAVFDSITYDVRRVPYIQATITAPTPNDATLALLDPRRSRSPILNWNIKRYERDGAGGDFTELHSWAPMAWPVDVAGKLYVRSITRDWLNDTITIEAASGEVITEDKHNIAAVAHSTTHDDVAEKVRFAVEDAGGRLVYVDSSAAATAVPTGDARIWLQGEPLSQYYEADLAALDLRLFMDEVGDFHVRPFTLPPTWGSNTELSDGDAGTIISMESSIDRDDWRDATLVKVSYVDGSGVQQTDWDFYPSTGANRKGEVTTLERALPSSGYAQSITERAAERSDRVRIMAMLDFNYAPGRQIDLTLTGGISDTINPERITYRPDAGTVEIVGFRV